MSYTNPLPGYIKVSLGILWAKVWQKTDIRDNRELALESNPFRSECRPKEPKMATGDIPLRSRGVNFPSLGTQLSFIWTQLVPTR